MSLSGHELFFAVRPRLIGHYFGQFCLIIASLNLVTLTVALFTAPWHISLSHLLITVVLVLSWFVLRHVKVSAEIQMNEAMVLVALAFLSVALIMTIPLLVAGIPFIDALFETISAVTTTGLSTLPGLDAQPLIFSFSRAWMQWYGGLGIVVFSLALVIRPGRSALRLASRDEPEDLLGGTRMHARRALTVYCLLTLLGIILWLLFGGSLRNAVLYTLSAISTGGFAPTAGSFTDLPHMRLAWIATLTATAGMLPLMLYHQVWRNGLRSLLSNIEIRLLCVLLLTFTALMYLTLWQQGYAWNAALQHAALMVFSAQSTSGFSSLDVSSLDNTAKLLLTLAMGIGGGVGSTAGGIKLLRLLVLITLIRHLLYSISVPSNTVIEQKIGKRIIQAGEARDALMIILLFVAVILLSWLVFIAYGYAPLDALFEVVSATATTGLSTGIATQELPTILKSVLCVDMLLGRLECVAWLVFFYHRTWLGRKRDTL